MTTKLVSLLAVLVFSFSAFANKAREISPETKAKMESIKKLQGKEANDQIIRDLLNAEYKGKAQEKLQSGLDSLFGKEDVIKKIEFGGRLKTLLESSDRATKNAGLHMRGLLERLSEMDGDVQESVKILLKNSEISMTEVSGTYEAQLASTNLLTYKLYVKGEKSITAETIELVGIANVMKSQLNLTGKGEGKSDVITSLKDLTPEQLKEVRKQLAEWKQKCNA